MQNVSKSFEHRAREVLRASQLEDVETFPTCSELVRVFVGSCDPKEITLNLHYMLMNILNHQTNPITITPELVHNLVNVADYFIASKADKVKEEEYSSIISFSEKEVTIEICSKVCLCIEGLFTLRVLTKLYLPRIIPFLCSEASDSAWLCVKSLIDTEDVKLINVTLEAFMSVIWEGPAPQEGYCGELPSELDGGPEQPYSYGVVEGFVECMGFPSLRSMRSLSTCSDDDQLSDDLGSFRPIQNKVNKNELAIKAVKLRSAVFYMCSTTWGGVKGAGSEYGGGICLPMWPQVLEALLHSILDCFHPEVLKEVLVCVCHLVKNYSADMVVVQLPFIFRILRATLAGFLILEEIAKNNDEKSREEEDEDDVGKEEDDNDYDDDDGTNSSVEVDIEQERDSTIASIEYDDSSAGADQSGVPIASGIPIVVNHRRLNKKLRTVSFSQVVHTTFAERSEKFLGMHVAVIECLYATNDPVVLAGQFKESLFLFEEILLNITSTGMIRFAPDPASMSTSVSPEEKDEQKNNLYISEFDDLVERSSFLLADHSGLFRSLLIRRVKGDPQWQSRRPIEDQFRAWVDDVSVLFSRLCNRQQPAPSLSSFEHALRLRAAADSNSSIYQTAVKEDGDKQDTTVDVHTTGLVSVLNTLSGLFDAPELGCAAALPSSSENALNLATLVAQALPPESLYVLMERTASFAVRSAVASLISTCYFRSSSEIWLELLLFCVQNTSDGDTQTRHVTSIIEYIDSSYNKIEPTHIKKFLGAFINVLRESSGYSNLPCTTLSILDFCWRLHVNANGILSLVVLAKDGMHVKRLENSGLDISFLRSGSGSDTGAGGVSEKPRHRVPVGSSQLNVLEACISVYRRTSTVLNTHHGTSSSSSNHFGIDNICLLTMFFALSNGQIQLGVENNTQMSSLINSLVDVAGLLSRSVQNGDGVDYFILNSIATERERKVAFALTLCGAEGSSSTTDGSIVLPKRFWPLFMWAERANLVISIDHTHGHDQTGTLFHLDEFKLVMRILSVLLDLAAVSKELISPSTLSRVSSLFTGFTHGHGSHSNVGSPKSSHGVPSHLKVSVTHDAWWSISGSMLALLMADLPKVSHGPLQGLGLLILAYVQRSTVDLMKSASMNVREDRSQSAPVGKRYNYTSLISSSQHSIYQLSRCSSLVWGVTLKFLTDHKKARSPSSSPPSTPSTPVSGVFSRDLIDNIVTNIVHIFSALSTFQKRFDIRTGDEERGLSKDTGQTRERVLTERSTKNRSADDLITELSSSMNLSLMLLVESSIALAPQLSRQARLSIAHAAASLNHINPNTGTVVAAAMLSGKDYSGASKMPPFQVALLARWDSFESCLTQWWSHGHRLLEVRLGVGKDAETLMVCSRSCFERFFMCLSAPLLVTEDYLSPIDGRSRSVSGTAEAESGDPSTFIPRVKSTDSDDHGIGSGRGSFDSSIRSGDTDRDAYGRASTSSLISADAAVADMVHDLFWTLPSAPASGDVGGGVGGGVGGDEGGIDLRRLDTFGSPPPSQNQSFVVDDEEVDQEDGIGPLLAPSGTGRDRRVKALLNAVSVLDRTPTCAAHKVALLFRPCGAQGEEDIIGCSRTSQSFREFAESLGQFVPTTQLTYSGGLDLSAMQSDGKDALLSRDEYGIIVFHAPSFMPEGSGPDLHARLLNRKKHIGNDVVHIVFCEDDDAWNNGVGVGDSSPSFLTSAFGIVEIVVAGQQGPRDKRLVRVDVRVKNNVPELQWLAVTQVLPESKCVPFVRAYCALASNGARTCLRPFLGDDLSHLLLRNQYISDIKRRFGVQVSPPDFK